MSIEKSLLPGATRDLAAFASNLQYTAIPREAIERMKLSVLDSIGCCIFGATLPWTRKVATLAKAEGAAPVASLMGMGEKTSIALAVLVNGTGGHAFELDDIHKESIVHAGSIATPIAFAFAEQQGGAPGKDILTAMIAGYEVGHRVGSAATMSLFFRGFHPQGTSGTFVAAATAARALGLNAVRFHAARVRVTTRDGRSFEKRILHRRGGPEAPLKPQDIEYKFRHVVRSCIPEDRMSRIMDLVRGLETLDNTGELLQLVAAPTN